MIALFAKLRVKPDQVDRFLKFLRADLEGSLREPGCFHFDVLRDEKDEHLYYIYEVYRDAAAYEVHREAPYFKAFFAEASDTLAVPPEGYFGTVVLPTNPGYWAKREG